MNRPCFIATRRVAPFALPLCFSLGLHASPELQPLVVTATRQAVPLNEQLSDVTVLSREQIDQAGNATLAELLGRQAGVEFTSNGGIGTSNDVFIRGAYATQTVVLVDGMRIGSATLGTANFSRLPLSQIERVEILRGPASSLYGADAIGGVIQIFTRRGDGPARINASAAAGSYGTREMTAGVQGGNAEASFSLQAGHYETKGFSALRNPAASGYNPDRDGYRSDTLSGSFSIRPKAGHEIGLNFLYSTGRNQYDTTPVGIDHSLDQDQINYSVFSRNTLTEGWTSTVRLGRAIDDSTTLRGGIRNAIIRTEQDHWQWQNDIRLWGGQLLLAVEEMRQQVGGTTAFPVSERQIRSYVSGWSGAFGAHRVQASLRHDNNSQFGARNTGNLAYGYQLTPDWRARVAAGTAFRAPTFNQLYFPNFGNVALLPEDARNREVGLVWERNGHQANVTYYDNRISNLIVNVGSPSQPRNVSKAQLKGLTFSYGGSFAGTRLDASLDVSRPEDADGGLRLPRRAAQQLKLAAARDFAGWLTGIEFSASGRRFDDVANQQAMGGYALTHLFVEKSLEKGLTLFARANNIFDRDYELARNYGTAGANFFIGLRYQGQ